MTHRLASVGQFPPALGRTVGSRTAPVGLLLLTCITLVFTLFVRPEQDRLNRPHRGVALIVFTMVTLGHFLLRGKTGANVLVLAAAPG